jgi:hypothetical protein
MKYRPTIAAILLCLTLIPAKCFAAKDNDFQIWSTGGVEAKLNKDLKLDVEQELRFGDDVSDFYYTHTEGTLDYKVTKGLSLGIGYRQIYEKKHGDWKGENMPNSNVTLDWSWRGFTFQDRNRLELRIPEDGQDKWRYRNKLTVLLPIKVTEFDVQPYVADEVFFDFHGDNFTRNRLFAGIKAKFFGHLKTDLFYLWQASEQGKDWIDYHVLGIKLKVAF